MSKRVMPYQIKLDVGQLIMAPMDSNVVVRKMPEGSENERENSMRVVLAKLQSMTEVERLKRLEMYVVTLSIVSLEH